jgi:hypothetical protein
MSLPISGCAERIAPSRLAVLRVPWLVLWLLLVRDLFILPSDWRLLREDAALDLAAAIGFNLNIVLCGSARGPSSFVPRG